MELYFGKEIEGNKIILDEDESNHLVNVRRSNRNDKVFVTDGEGHLFTTSIENTEKKHCILKIIEKVTHIRNPFHLHIAVAPTKNIERIEWFLEKAIETGIDEITFLRCRHSERKEVKMERLDRIAVSAMKQSVKTFLPKINPMTSLSDLVTGNISGTKLIFSMSAGAGENLKNNYHVGTDLIALIGPEGDFHADELELALQNGFRLTSLGTSRLRTETAALSVCTLFNFLSSK